MVPYYFSEGAPVPLTSPSRFFTFPLFNHLAFLASPFPPVNLTIWLGHPVHQLPGGLGTSYPPCTYVIFRSL